MKILKPTGTYQGLLGLKFDKHPIERDPKLLEIMKLNATISEKNSLPFDRITLPCRLSFEPIALEEEIQINAGVAHEMLLKIAAEGKAMPLCLWSVDTILGYKSRNGSTPDLPARSTPGKKLIILTHGIFNGLARNINCYIYLKKTESGFEICVTNTYQTFILYPKPGYDLVTLCIPTTSCSTSV